MKIFYTYLWLREDGTPYYVGKGFGDRAFIKDSHRVVCPKDKSLILVQEFPSEHDAFAAEKFLISYYGRVDLGTGCLRNMTEGGEGCSGRVATPELREKISKANKGQQLTPEQYTRMVAVRYKRQTNNALAEWRASGGTQKGTHRTIAPWNKGKVGVLSDAARDKIKAARAKQGDMHTAEVRRKMSESQKKRWAKIRGAV